MISILLVCAVLASLAAGVLLAYFICQLLFEIFRMHAESVSNASAPSVTAQAVQG